MSHQIPLAKQKKDFLPCHLPQLQAYKQQKKIHVVSSSKNISLTNFGHKFQNEHCPQEKIAFFTRARINAALQYYSTLVKNPAQDKLPAYFPGHTIPSPGGLHCQEIYRGNLLLTQFRHLLSYDEQTRRRLSGANPLKTPAFTLSPVEASAWAWQTVEQPELVFIKQNSSASQEKPDDKEVETILAIIEKQLATDYARLKANHFNDLQAMAQFLSTIQDFWFHSPNKHSPGTYGSKALGLAQSLLRKEATGINKKNLAAFAFELEALTSFQSISEKHIFREAKHLASGLFAGNFMEVFNLPLENFQATELVLSDRLLDEIINSFSRGFAPIIVNEYGLVADGNHRITTTWLFNLLKFCQSENWCLEDASFQNRIALFFKECASARSKLLPFKKALWPVTTHEILKHLQIFLSNPEYRSRLKSYIAPLISRHGYITELPAVLLPEYLGQAVVKESYDAGLKIERACPSLYQAMAQNKHYVLPPRASYHFTDAALLPWFPVAKKETLSSSNCTNTLASNRAITNTNSSSSFSFSSSGGSL
jgi:hypothetical protein